MSETDVYCVSILSDPEATMIRPIRYIPIRPILGLELVDIAVIDDMSAWLVAKVNTTRRGRSSIQTPEYRLIELDLRMVVGNISQPIPFVHSIKHVACSSDGLAALISFSDGAPSQLVSQRTKTQIHPVRCFKTSGSHDSIGPTQQCKLFSHAYADSDRIIIGGCADGFVHLWDPITCEVLHKIDSNSSQPYPGGALTSVGWNQASSSCIMMAVGTSDGDIALWRAPVPVNARPPPVFDHIPSLPDLSAVQNIPLPGDGISNSEDLADEAVSRSNGD
ncbi:hypothetical protein DL93DRAFT_1710033 [Clavulina sp. PMI_390]|nr:hypothetical protein DL93DRAFT_1710033 [Clavulina sp. PMI_390]